jgi:putative transcriptional regulator
MTINSHLSDDLLLGYSAGSLDEPSSLIVASHLALCPHCRTRNASADALGGFMLDSLPETPVSTGLMSSVLDRIRRDDQLSFAPLTTLSAASKNYILPEPLRSYVGGDAYDLPWIRMAPRVHQIQIQTKNRQSAARLLRFQSGTSVPAHGHGGRELTLVLTGSLCDRDTVLCRGDIAETDERTEHQPHAGPDEDCICLAVTDAPLRFKSMFARLLQPLFGI